MGSRLLRLYPGAPQDVALAGAYLAHDLAAQGSAAQPLVYGDFLSSLDGRIALGEPKSGKGEIPAALRTEADFRLLQELEAQADCVIINSSYLRDVAAGRLEDIMQVGIREGSGDLAQWRAQHDLAPQPAICIVSGSLDFTIAPSLAQHGQRVMVATAPGAPAEQRQALRRVGYEVFNAGHDRQVEGGPLTRALGERGFRSLFLLAGPRMLETMLRDGMLGRLYLTLAHRLIGGEQFHSMIEGHVLGPAGRMRLAELYYDAPEGDGDGAFFCRFDALREGA